jgi:hypothetical protein
MKYETDLEFFIAYLVSIGANFNHSTTKDEDLSIDTISVIEWGMVKSLFSSEGAFLIQQVEL